jgi:serine/threonine protein kinase
MASIWIARLTGKHGFEKLFAIKTILPQYATDLRFQQMFLDEARIASAIDHANVAHIIDLGEEGDVLYLVMEWIEGDSLSKLNRAVQKRGKRLPVGVVLRILADICGGLHAAHEMHTQEGNNLGVVHRDVSPQNILISTKGIAKLIDFGVAKARDRVAGETSAGQLKGKIHYMAPEQALGRHVDRRADVWSIGAVGYHLLAGVPPFDGANELATLHMLTSGKQPPALPDHVPIAVADPIFRALVDNPDERIRTAYELQRALEQAMFDAGVMTTTSDVAELCAQYLSDRIEARRRSVQKALQAASERGTTMPPRRVRPTSGDSSSGVDHPVSQIKEAGSVSSSLHMPGPVRPTSTASGLGPGGSDAPSPLSGSRSGLSGPGAPGSYSGSSLGGLSSPGSSASGAGMLSGGGMAAHPEFEVEIGSADVDPSSLSSSLASAGSEVQWPPAFAAASWRRWALWGAAAGLGVFALIVAVSLAFRHSPQPTASPVAAQPSPTSAQPDTPVANTAGPTTIDPGASASARAGSQSVAGSLPPLQQGQRPTSSPKTQSAPVRSSPPKSTTQSPPSPKKPAGNDYGF